MEQTHTARIYGFVRTLDVLIALTVLFAVFLWVNHAYMPQGVEGFLALRVKTTNFLKLGVLAYLWPKIFHWFGLYEIDEAVSWHNKFARLVKACAVGSLVVAIYPLLNNTKAFRESHVVWFWLGTILFSGLVRLIIFALTHPFVQNGSEVRKLLIVGSSERAYHLYEKLCAMPQPRYELLGFVDSNLPPQAPDFVRSHLLGKREQLEDILFSQIVDEVLIALPIKSQYAQIEEALQVCKRVGVEARFYSDMFDFDWAQARLGIEGAPVFAMKPVLYDARHMIKRTVDICGACGGLLLLGPLLLLVALAIKVTSRGPVFFIQERLGQGKRRFRMYKFRTMVADAEAKLMHLEKFNQALGPIFKMKDDPRITPLGSFLRKTSLDELPQLLNVLKGEMSLVGPRPLPLRDFSQFDEAWLMRRFCVQPGLTCLWQISGRNEMDGNNLVTLDLEYIDSWSLQLDFQILAKTLPVVWRGTGAN